MAPNPIGNAGSQAKKGSDVVHRLGRRPALDGMPLQIFEGRAVYHGVHRLRYCSPQVAQIPRGIRRRAMGSAPGGSHSRTPLDGPEQSANRDLVGCFGETVTARRSASRVEESRPLEPEQHLLEVPLRYAPSPRDVLDGLQRSPVVGEGQVEHRLDGVLALAEAVPAAPGPGSAPARRIPVRASIIAASSSSQPSWPAARSIAYSPDTEYAATGRPNSLLTLAMMSRYGRAGLTITISAPSSTSRATSRMASTEFAGSI